MIRNVLSLTAAGLFLTLASACATNGPQPTAQPAAAPVQKSAAPAPAQTAAPALVASTTPVNK